MNYETESWAVTTLLDKFRAGCIKADPEYQRGWAWNRTQQKQFIDSILRGYPVPAIFLHDKGEEKYAIVDGQQRINALNQYLSGHYKLLYAKQAEKRFPSLVYGMHGDEQWGGKGFNDLLTTLQNKLNGKDIPVVILRGNDKEERDLFIRLQEGSVLNDQEKRDAWPGDFTKFIFNIGGRHGICDEYGKECEPHRFFREVMRMKPSHGPKGDRGTVRKTAAQLYQVHASYARDRQIKGIGKTELDRLYMDNQKFKHSDPQGATRKSFVACLKVLSQIFDMAASRNQGNRYLYGSIDLMLLGTTLLQHISEGDCVAIGRNLQHAHKNFHDKCDEANRKNDEEKQRDEYWLRYRQWTSQQADSPRTIKRRHAFYLEKMAEISATGVVNTGPAPNPDAPEILRRVCKILKQAACDLHSDLATSRNDNHGDEDE